MVPSLEILFCHLSSLLLLLLLRLLRAAAPYKHSQRRRRGRVPRSSHGGRHGAAGAAVVSFVLQEHGERRERGEENKSVDDDIDGKKGEKPRETYSFDSLCSRLFLQRSSRVPPVRCGALLFSLLAREKLCISSSFVSRRRAGPRPPERAIAGPLATTLLLIVEPPPPTLSLRPPLAC